MTYRKTVKQSQSREMPTGVSCLQWCWKPGVCLRDLGRPCGGCVLVLGWGRALHRLQPSPGRCSTGRSRPLPRAASGVPASAPGKREVVLRAEVDLRVEV